MRARCVIALMLVSSAGCRQLLGFEDPVVADLDAPPATYEVTGTYRQRFGGNDAMLNPTVVPRIRPVGELKMVATLADGSMQTVDYRADGTFSFPRTGPDQPYRFRAGSVEYQLSSPTLALGEFSPGRIDAIPVTLPTPLRVRLGNQPSGNPYLVTTGVWGQHVPLVAAGTGDFDVDWQSVNGLPPFGLLDATKNDRVYIGYLDVTSAPQAYTVMTRIHSAAITQSNGQTATMNGGTQLVTRDLCVRQQARRADAMTRVATALPMFSSLTAEYRISAAPNLDFQFLPNFLLAYDVTTGMSDSNLDVRYGNPFPGTQVLNGIAVTGYRDVTLREVLGTLRLVVVGLQSYQIAADGACTVAMPAFEVGIAAVPSLDGVPLTTDDATLVIAGTEPFSISWELGSVGLVDYTIVIIHEVVASVVPPQLREVKRIITLGKSVTVDRDTFVSGRHYLIGLQTVAGAPLAGRGDFETVAYPTGFMTTLSSPFKVGG